MTVRRPRARTLDGREVALASYGMFAADDQLEQVVFERMLAELATRRHGAAAEPVGQAVEDARELERLMARDLGELDTAVVMVDGISFADPCCVVALAVTADGTKVPVGLWLGDTENATVVRSLLADLVARGLDATGGLLVVIRRRPGVGVGGASRVRRARADPALHSALCRPPDYADVVDEGAGHGRSGGGVGRHIHGLREGPGAIRGRMSSLVAQSAT